MAAPEKNVWGTSPPHPKSRFPLPSSLPSRLFGASSDFQGSLLTGIWPVLCEPPPASLQPHKSCKVSLPLESSLTHLYLHLFRTLLYQNHLTLRKARKPCQPFNYEHTPLEDTDLPGRSFCEALSATGVRRVSGVSVMWWLTEHVWSRRIISPGRLEQRAPLPRACPAKSS